MATVLKKFTIQEKQRSHYNARTKRWVPTHDVCSRGRPGTIQSVFADVLIYSTPSLRYFSLGGSQLRPREHRVGRSSKPLRSSGQERLSKEVKSKGSVEFSQVERQRPNFARRELPGRKSRGKKNHRTPEFVTGWGV